MLSKEPLGAKHWLERATEARRLAADLRHDLERREAFLRLAEGFERLARRSLLEGKDSQEPDNPK